MTPMSFDPATCRALVGDTRARVIEQQARQHADSADLGSPDTGFHPPPTGPARTYWGEVQASAESLVYAAAYRQRIARRQRKEDAC